MVMNFTTRRAGGGLRGNRRFHLVGLGIRLNNNTYGSIKKREVNWGSRNHNNDSGNGDDYGGGVCARTSTTSMTTRTMRTKKMRTTPMKKKIANVLTFYTIGHQKLL
jgi:hypothetical protein